ncbi:MFS transporter [Vespertiliibacter pulmonis]|uniref:MFS transporter n=1 Tax=Vespertiliibacter pulmonis TaxID=1443036 RepID=A0A3N4VT96_9PAST|nr:MFS transporter [Vespertiliibacter pulmonis]QLB20356.1 MFS transporter [Vespertiliibacter pulmonis]RPE86342.1 MFS transporter [Vespertiliibacter pulmonis]
MSLESNGYTFKPHEMPFMAGSPASPDHPVRRRIFYFLIGVLLSVTAGLQNGILMAAMPQLQASLALQVDQVGWIQVSYYMTYACMSIFFFKFRQHFGLQHFVRTVLFLLLIANVLQALNISFTVEIIARGISGIAASGLMVLGMFYLLQSMKGNGKLIALALTTGLMQLGTPLAQITVPFIAGDGNIHTITLFQLSLTLLCIGLVIWLPIPPGVHTKALSWLDLICFSLFAIGIATLCAFFTQGRTISWDTPWIGYLLIISIICIGIAILIESQRKSPILDWQWLTTRQIITFGLMSAIVRMLISEQTVGAAGLMKSLGMNNDQMVTFYTVTFIASIVGIILSVITFNILDIRKPISIALLGIAIGSFIDIGVGVQTRPEQLYISQAIIAFSALYFMGPMMLEGLIRALAKGPSHIMSFSAIFGLSQTLGGLGGAALFSQFITYRTKEHLADMTSYLSLTNPQVTLGLKQLSAIFSPLTTDPIILQSQATTLLIRQTSLEAQVLAYNDLFIIIGVGASIAFIYSIISRIYYRYHKINIIGKELAVLMQSMPK